MLKILSIIILVFFVHSQSNAQAFGFGCLGLVGGYGGFSYQRYNPTGLNEYIAVFNKINSSTLKNPMNNFGEAKGWRVGVNLFRANITGLILTAKGFYQSLSEKNDAAESFDSGEGHTTFELALKNWGVGLDLGIQLVEGLSWKVIDGALHFNNTTFTSTQSLPDSPTEVLIFKTDKPALGYSIGTGFILALIEDYISIEGAAGFTVLRVDKLRGEDNNYLAYLNDENDTVRNFIESGGFNAVIQINIGFPL